MAEESTLLGEEIPIAAKSLVKNLEQMEGGFFRLNRSTGFEEVNPLSQDAIEKNPELDTFQEKTGVSKSDLFLPFGLTQSIVTEIQDLLAIGDPLNMSETELESYQSRTNAIVGQISIPTADQITDFINAFNSLVNHTKDETDAIPVQTKDIQILSTDINLDSFIRRTGFRKAMIIELNKLQFPYIAKRLSIPSQEQADVITPVGVQGEKNITFASLFHYENSGIPEVGSKVLITNNARFDADLNQQKSSIDWIDEAVLEFRMEDALLFNVDSTYVVEIFQDTVYQVLEVGKTIKVPA